MGNECCLPRPVIDPATDGPGVVTIAPSPVLQTVTQPSSSLKIFPSSASATNNNNNLTIVLNHDNGKREELIASARVEIPTLPSVDPRISNSSLGTAVTSTATLSPPSAISKTLTVAEEDLADTQSPSRPKQPYQRNVNRWTPPSVHKSSATNSKSKSRNSSNKKNSNAARRSNSSKSTGRKQPPPPQATTAATAAGSPPQQRQETYEERSNRKERAKQKVIADRGPSVADVNQYTAMSRYADIIDELHANREQPLQNLSLPDGIVLGSPPPTQRPQSRRLIIPPSTAPDIIISPPPIPEILPPVRSPPVHTRRHTQFVRTVSSATDLSTCSTTSHIITSVNIVPVVS